MQSENELFFFTVYYVEPLIHIIGCYIYLAVSYLSCGTWALCCGFQAFLQLWGASLVALWHVGSQFPNQGSNPHALPQKVNSQPLGLPGKSLQHVLNSVFSGAWRLEFLGRPRCEFPTPVPQKDLDLQTSKARTFRVLDRPSLLASLELSPHFLHEGWYLSWEPRQRAWGRSAGLGVRLKKERVGQMERVTWKHIHQHM